VALVKLVEADNASFVVVAESVAMRQRPRLPACEGDSAHRVLVFGLMALPLLCRVTPQRSSLELQVTALLA